MGYWFPPRVPPQPLWGDLETGRVWTLNLSFPGKLVNLSDYEQEALSGQA